MTGYHDFMRWLLLCSAVVGSAGCSAFEHGCTTVGCSDSVSIDLRAAGASFADGTYTITMTADGVVAVRTCLVPAPPDSVSCGSDRDVWVVSDRTHFQVVLTGTPKMVEVKLARGATQLVETTFTPVYSEHRPNGDGCDPVCKGAGITVTVPS